MLDRPEDKVKDDMVFDDIVFGEKAHILRIKLVSFLKETIQQLEEYIKLSNIYHRHLSPFDLLRFNFLQRLHSLLQFNREYPPFGYEDFEQVGYDPAFIKAASKYISRIVEDYRRAGCLPSNSETLNEERQRIEAIGDWLKEIRFEGFDAPEGTVAVITPPEILNTIRKLLPPDFIQGLKLFSCKDNPDKSFESDSKGKKIGAFSPLFIENGTIDSKIEIYMKPFIPQTANKLEELFVMSQFMRTIWHELGHCAHCVLRYDELRAWEQAINKDATPVTWYVQYAREDNPNRGKREDFAESFMLFLTCPALLQTISPLRYQFFYEFFIKRLKTEQIVYFETYMAQKINSDYNLWRTSSLSPEDVKRLYLEDF